MFSCLVLRPSYKKAHRGRGNIEKKWHQWKILFWSLDCSVLLSRTHKLRQRSGSLLRKDSLNSPVSWNCLHRTWLVRQFWCCDPARRDLYCQEGNNDQRENLFVIFLFKSSRLQVKTLLMNHSVCGCEWCNFLKMPLIAINLFQSGFLFLQ